MPRLNKNNLNTGQILLAYISFVGDCERTAAALHLDPEVVRNLAESEGWKEQISRITLLSKSGKSGDFERSQNRALVFIQAYRLRRIVDDIIERLEGLTPEEVVEELRVTTRAGTHLSARFLADLASVSEKSAQMSFAALGDSLGERAERSEAGDGMDIGSIHLAVINALNGKTVNLSAELETQRDETVKKLLPPEPTP